MKIDLSKVKVEPLFEDAVDFDTFSKSDFRVVKVEACEAVPKSKKLLKFTLNDGTDRKRTILSGIHEYYERKSWSERPVWRSQICAEEDDGYRLRGNADQCRV